MTFVGSKGRPPPANRPKEWTEFQREFLRLKQQEQTIARQRRKQFEQDLASEIERQESLPQNAGRKTHLASLRKRLTESKSRPQI
jgi:hypothetical protein